MSDKKGKVRIHRIIAGVAAVIAVLFVCNWVVRLNEVDDRVSWLEWALSRRDDLEFRGFRHAVVRIKLPNQREISGVILNHGNTVLTVLKPFRDANATTCSVGILDPKTSSYVYTSSRIAKEYPERNIVTLQSGRTLTNRNCPACTDVRVSVPSFGYITSLRPLSVMASGQLTRESGPQLHLVTRGVTLSHFVDRFQAVSVDYSHGDEAGSPLFTSDGKVAGVVEGAYCDESSSETVTVVSMLPLFGEK